MQAENNYTGIWVTANGYIRQELLPDGRYDETRGTRKSAYTGRYRISGNYICTGTIWALQPMAALATAIPCITEAMFFTEKINSRQAAIFKYLHYL